MSDSNVVGLISDQLGKILDKQIEQGERLVRIETNHTNLNSMLSKVNETLKEISKTDQEQSEKIEAVSIKTDSIEETLRGMKEDQKKMDSRIAELEVRVAVEEGAEKGEAVKYQFWSDLTSKPIFKWSLFGLGVLIVVLVTGRTDWLIKLVEIVTP